MGERLIEGLRGWLSVLIAAIGILAGGAHAWSNLNERLARIESRVASGDLKNDHRKGEISDLKQTINKLSDKVDRLNTQLAGVASDVKTIKERRSRRGRHR